ncbi:MAG: hypothetical protein U9O55_00415 [Patescibacteria group bacterium]|nr:hypothetical protein [Patescibacteria group bacterium]
MCKRAWLWRDEKKMEELYIWLFFHTDFIFSDLIFYPDFQDDRAEENEDDFFLETQKAGNCLFNDNCLSIWNEAHPDYARPLLRRGLRSLIE